MYHYFYLFPLVKDSIFYNTDFYPWHYVISNIAGWIKKKKRRGITGEEEINWKTIPKNIETASIREFQENSIDVNKKRCPLPSTVSAITNPFRSNLHENTIFWKHPRKNILKKWNKNFITVHNKINRFKNPLKIKQVLIKVYYRLWTRLKRP